MIKDKRLLRVFLCHASGDKPAISRLYEQLVKDGVDAWLDKEKLIPGQNWQFEIPKAINTSDAVIVCLSNKSITKEGFVQKEIKFALDIADEKPDGTIFIIPARLENCDIPERLKKIHWVDLFSTNGYEQLFKALQERAKGIGIHIEQNKSKEGILKATGFRKNYAGEGQYYFDEVVTEFVQNYVQVTETSISILNGIRKEFEEKGTCYVTTCWQPNSPEDIDKFKLIDVNEAIKNEDPKWEARKEIKSKITHNISLAEIGNVELRTCGGGQNSGKIIFYNKKIQGGWLNKLFSKIVDIEFTLEQEEHFINFYKYLKTQIPA